MEPTNAMKLDSLLGELVEIGQRRRPGQVTHKIAEIETLVRLIEDEAYLRGLNESEADRADAIERTKNHIESLRNLKV